MSMNEDTRTNIENISVTFHSTKCHLNTVPIGRFGSRYRNQLLLKCQSFLTEMLIGKKIIMFSSKKRLQEKTPPEGIDRKEFINLLVDEYYETTNVGTHQ